MEQPIAPYGGVLTRPLVTDTRAREVRAESREWPSWQLTRRQLCDLELLLNGSFSPLSGFMGRADYESVRDGMRLTDGTLWPIPVTLDVPSELARTLAPATQLALRDPEGVILAALHIEELWEPDRDVEAERVLGTRSSAHPGAEYLLRRTHPVYLSGRLEGLGLPIHYDFRELRPTPSELREELARLGWRDVVAFQTRNPMHRAHQELTLRAARQTGANLLVHPVVGMTQPADVDPYTRVRCYQAVMGHYPPSTAKLALLELAMRMAGPREAVWHAIIRRNYGCSHLIVGRDHASPGAERGRPIYGPYDAQALLAEVQSEIGVEMVPFREMVYVAATGKHMPTDEVPAGAHTCTISGTELRTLLDDGKEIPDWFTFPEVARELSRRRPPRARQGFTVFFTGLPCAGKSTIAKVLRAKLLETGARSVTLLDGDIVRKNLSSELGFSREHRELNVRRIGFVAAEVTRAGGVAICAAIAPYDASRRANRELISQAGGYFLVHVATPLEVCEQRDHKGLYAKARAGLLANFTGVSDPYEPPDDAVLTIDTTTVGPEEAAQEVLLQLLRAGYVEVTESDGSGFYR